MIKVISPYKAYESNRKHALVQATKLVIENFDGVRPEDDIVVLWPETPEEPRHTEAVARDLIAGYPRKEARRYFVAVPYHRSPGRDLIRGWFLRLIEAQ